MKKLLKFILPLLVLSSCIKEIPLVSTEYVEPKPVFYMFINPDSFLKSSYSRATSITAPDEKVNNALISIFRNGILQGDMNNINPGEYALWSNSFLPRDSFRIYGSDGLYSFFIRGRIPSYVVFKQLDTQTLLIPGVGPAFTLDLTFTDSAVDDNFYRLSLKRTWYRYTLDKNLQRTDSVLVKSFVNISGSELAFIQNNYNNYTSRELIFSDATFNGTTSKFRIYTPEQIHETIASRTLSVELVLDNMEKPMFEYYNTRNAHLWQQQSISQLPGSVAGNVTGGFGVGAAYTTVSRLILIR